MVYIWFQRNQEKAFEYKVCGLAMFGKAIGNRCAINAILGKQEFMKNVNETLAQYFWTERLGNVAAQSIKYMNNTKLC